MAMNYELIVQTLTAVAGGGFSVLMFIKAQSSKQREQERQNNQDLDQRIGEKLSNFEIKMKSNFTDLINVLNTSIERQLSGLKANIDTLSERQTNKFDNITSELQTISITVTELSERVNELKTKSSTTTQAIEALEAQVSDIKSKYDILSKEMQDMKIEFARCNNRHNPTHQ